MRQIGRLAAARGLCAFCMAFASCAPAAASGIPAPRAVTVAETLGDMSGDDGAAPGAAYCRQVMEHLFEKARLTAVRVRHADRRPAADVVFAAFRTPELLKSFNIPFQPLCRIRFALYATPARARALRAAAPPDWPSLRVAFAPAPCGADDGLKRFFETSGIPHTPVACPTRAAAAQAVERGEADLLFLAAAAGRRPPGLEQVVKIGERNVYFAVSRERGDLFRLLTETYRACYVGEPGLFDTWRKTHFGVEPPTNRVRVAAFAYPGVFQRLGKARPQGRLADWMEILAREKGWTVDWVCGTYAQGADDVAAGRLDLAYGIADTPANRARFAFPPVPVGYRQLILWTPRDAPYVPNDATTWSGMRIAHLQGSPTAQQLRDMLRARGVAAAFVPYENEADLLAAYHRRAVDAVIAAACDGLLYEKRLLVQIPEPAYLCTAKGNARLAAALTDALGSLTRRETHFVRGLSVQHRIVKDFDLSAYTKAERDWLTARRLAGGYVTVAFSPRDADGRDFGGGLEGHGKVIFEEISRRTGLQFRMAPPTDVKTARTRFLRGETPLWAAYPLTFDEDFYGFGEKVFSFTIPQLYSRRAGLPKNIIATGKIAVNRQNAASVSACCQPDLIDRLVFCDGVPDCYRALLDRRADCTVVPISLGGRVIEALGCGRQVENEVFDGMRDRDAYELVAGPKAPPELVSIIRKAAQSVDRARIKEFFVMGELARQRDANFRERYMGMTSAQVGKVFSALALVVLVSVLVALILLVRAVERERGDRRRIAAERDRALAAEKAKSLFFSSVSHDIRTPLNALIGFSELLEQGVDDKAELGRYVATIRSSGRMLARLVNDILDLSKLESGKLEILKEPTDAAALAREVAAAFDVTRANKALAFTEDIAPMPRVQVDPQRLRQILHNLLSNAFKYTSEGGVALRTAWRDGTFTLAVEDTGKGISQEDIARILQPFEQVVDRNHRDGTGLGLSICQRLAALMGGELTIASEVGRGSTFTVTLRHVEVAEEDAAAGAPASDARPPSAPAAAPHVLVVDDSSVNRLVLKSMLARCGVSRPLLAKNGKAALELLRKDPSVDLVLTDFWMPEMDGEALVAAIRADAARRHLPVYLITADVETVAQHRERGFTGVLLKPVTLAAVKELLDHPHPPPPPPPFAAGARVGCGEGASGAADGASLEETPA